MKIEDCKPGVWVTADGMVGYVMNATRTGVAVHLYRLDDGGEIVGYEMTSKTVNELERATEHQVDACGHAFAQVLAKSHQAENERRETEARQWAERLATVDWSKEDTSTIRSVAVVMGWNTEDDS